MWTAHDNAIFDVCWSNDDASILTAGGDQTVKLWDIETRSLKHLFASHTCSVKSINANPEDPRKNKMIYIHSLTVFFHTHTPSLKRCLCYSS